jgi:hypothetical protein
MLQQSAGGHFVEILVRHRSRQCNGLRYRLSCSATLPSSWGKISLLVFSSHGSNRKTRMFVCGIVRAPFRTTGGRMLLTVFLFFLGWVFLTSAFVIIVKGGAALAPKPPGVPRYLGFAYSGEEMRAPRPTQTLAHSRLRVPSTSLRS